MKKAFWICLLALLLCTGDALAEQTPQASGERFPVTLGEGSELPLRVLTRPMASLYKSASEGEVLQSNLPTFQSYYVYDRPGGEARDTGTGWYEVGTDDKGTVVGWLKADDVFEWQQTMCLAYTHPQGRMPVLMFEDKESLENLAKQEQAARAEAVGGLYASIEKAASGQQPLPKDFPVLSVEPKMAVDISKQFYLLPILEHQPVTLDGRESRLLRLAAVSGGGEKARKSSDVRVNQAYLEEATTGAEQKADSLKDIKIDLVWVVDTTRSMQPYIERTREVLTTVSKNLSAREGLNHMLAFGLWAYRDSTSIPGIEYNTKNVTPELLSVDAFLTAMADVKETSIDSVDVPEDMFAGIADAVEKTAWRDGALRLVVVVGDAPSHEAGHKWNASGKDENTLRALATERNVSILALHLNPPKTKRFNKVAERQLRALSLNPGTEKSYYWGINANDVASFGMMAEAITDTLVGYLEGAARQQSFDAMTPEERAAFLADPASKTDKQPAQARQAATLNADAPTSDDLKKLIQAAAVSWIGSQSGAKAPRDVEAWVTDKDLADPVRQSLEVRLLINKRQLDALATLLSEVLEAGRSNQVSGDDFFTSLQAASAVASRDPGMLANARNLAQSGMIPDFLAGLPYHSQLMDMNNDLWASWGPDEQDAFLNQIEAKVAAYAAVHDDPETWVALNAGDDSSEFVAPLPLELLP